MQISKKSLSVAMINAGVDTFKQLAQLSGTSVNTLSRITNGATATLQTVRKIALALGVQPKDIIKEE